jgi:alpha/beta superfamily hydrolase
MAAWVASILGIFVVPMTVLAQELPPSPLEETVCGAFKERIAFQNWSSAAGKPDDARVAEVPTAVRIEHKTIDGRTLVGFRVGSVAGVQRIGRILVIQGNGMLADHMLTTLEAFGELGFDSEVYDFRGYGRSNGDRRLKAMINDYRELVSKLANSEAGKFGVYALSFGGVLALNSLDAATPASRLIIDSTPSEISSLGCPAELDPIARLPESTRNLLAITGTNDNAVAPARSTPLGEAIRGKGGKFLLLKDFGHPYMDGVGQVLKRLRIVSAFIEGREEAIE